ncbi:hypothetical protein CRYUN_Cryun13aG0146600 [Craigia yunnanensis]
MLTLNHSTSTMTFPFSPTWLTKHSLKGRELKCFYKATNDGFSATNFLDFCDFKGPCVIIGYTDKSFKFGEFNPEGYKSTDDYYNTFDAFLFSWTDNKETNPIILPKIGLWAGLHPDTNSGIGDLRQAKSRLGLLYAKRKDGNDSLFGDMFKASLEEVQVFCSPQIASLY